MNITHRRHRDKKLHELTPQIIHQYVTENKTVDELVDLFDYRASIIVDILQHNEVYKSRYRNVYGTKIDDIVSFYEKDQRVTIGKLNKQFPSFNRYTLIRILESEDIAIRVEEKKDRYHLPEDIANEAIQQYEAGIVAQTIASNLNIPYNSILVLLDSRGMKRTFKENAQFKVLPPTYINTIEKLGDKITELYNDAEMTPDEISEHLSKDHDVSSAQIRDYLTSANVDLRSSKESANLSKTLQTRVEKFRAKYGVDNAMQVPDIYFKSNKTKFKLKTLDYKGIKFEQLQGYEPQAIKYIDQNLDVDISKLQHGRDVPTINYTFDGKNRVYIPDFYYPPTNTIFEVKSTYTYNVAIELNTAKAEATKAAGYNYTILILTDGGNLSQILT